MAEEETKVSPKHKFGASKAEEPPAVPEVEVVLLRDWDVHKKGDRIRVSPGTATSLISHSVATDPP